MLIQVIRCYGPGAVPPFGCRGNPGAQPSPEAGCLFVAGAESPKNSYQFVRKLLSRVVFLRGMFSMFDSYKQAFFGPSLSLSLLLRFAQDAVGCGTRSPAGPVLMLERWSPSLVPNISSTSPGTFLHVSTEFVQ